MRKKDVTVLDVRTAIKLVDKLNRDLVDVLVNKYLLFDTCVVSRLVSSKRDSPKKEIFDFLNTVHCIPGVSDFIYVECLRGHQSEKRFNETKNFLVKFPKRKLNVDQVTNFNEKLVAIDRINQKYGLSGAKASYVDLTSAVFLQNWSDSLFLATFNISDFCYKIFDVVTVLPVVIPSSDGESNTRMLLGIIKANKDNFKEELSKLE